jgi:hypothetical protein
MVRSCDRALGTGCGAMGFLAVLLGAVAWSGPFLMTAFVVLGWLDLLRPAPRRTLVTAGRPWGIVLVLWSALALLYWGSRLTGPPPGTEQVLDYVQGTYSNGKATPKARGRPTGGQSTTGRETCANLRPAH